MKKRAKQTKKFGIRRTKLKQEARKKRKPEPIRPVLYTRRVKTNKHKKLKNIPPPLSANLEGDDVNLDPLDDDEQKPPASFREMMWLKRNIESRHPFRLDPDVGDTKGMKKFRPTKPPQIGKKESEEAFSRRMERAAQEELLKVKLAKRANAPLADPETYKSKKAKRALKRLAEKKTVKKQFRHEKRLTGFEHLVDTVKFGEVVKAPPVLKTMPKKVGGKGSCESAPEPVSLDRRIAT